jgi:hypothetical protein
MADHNQIVTAIEYNYDVRAIQSEAASLYYLEDDDKKDIGILVVRDGTPMHIVLNKNQAYTLAKELKEVCDSIFYH